LLSFALFLPAMIYGAALAIRRIFSFRQRKTEQGRASAMDSDAGLQMDFLLLLFAFVAVYSLIHILSWANVRYRLPVDAVLIIFAGYGLWDIYLRIQRRFGQTASAINRDVH